MPRQGRTLVNHHGHATRSTNGRRLSRASIPGCAACHLTQDRGGMVAGTFQCRPCRPTATRGLSVPFHDPTTPASRRSSRLARFAATLARSGTLMKLFLSNSTTSPRSGATSPGHPTAPVPRRSKKLFPKHTPAEIPGQRQRRCPAQAHQHDRCLPSRFSSAIPDAVTTITGVAATSLDLLPGAGEAGPAARGILPRRPPGYTSRGLPVAAASSSRPVPLRPRKCWPACRTAVRHYLESRPRASGLRHRSTTRTAELQPARQPFPT